MSKSFDEFDELIEYKVEEQEEDEAEDWITEVKEEQHIEELVEEYLEDGQNSEVEELFENSEREKSVPSPRKQNTTSTTTIFQPRRFLLFDNLIAEVVDYDADDNAPIVEFSMCGNETDEEQLPVECGICPDVMPRSAIDRHVRSQHLKPGTKRYVCIYCGENFVSRAYAAGHARRHMGIRPYVCTPCKLYYCTKQDLRVHQQRRHWARDHVCEHCGKAFAQNTSLKAHRQLVHEQQQRFECSQCGKRFRRNYAMQEHVRQVHEGCARRTLDCPFCDRCFRDTHKLAQHRRDEHLQQASAFECRACGLAFMSIDFFDAHRRSLQCRKQYALKRAEGVARAAAEQSETVAKIKDQRQLDVVQTFKQEPQQYVIEVLEGVAAKPQELLYKITVDDGF